MNYLQPNQWASYLDANSNQLLLGGSAYWVQNAGQTWSLTNPSGDNTTLRFEVHAGDVWAPVDTGLNKNRDEIAGTTALPVGTAVHVAYDWTVEPGPANDSTWLVAGQLRQQVNDNWSPPFEVNMVGDKMAITIDEAGNNTNAWSYYKTIYTDAQNIVRGHTYAMQIDANFDPTNGYLHVVRDGVTLVDYHGPLGYPGMGSFVYWKEGIYRSEGTTTQAMDFSHLSITTGATQSPPPAAPAAPTGLSDAAIVGGYVNAARDTASQTLTGSSVAGATVTVYDGAAKLGVATANSSGQWSYTLGHLADGGHTLTATATTTAGVSASSAALTFTVDTQAPAAPTGLADSAIINGVVDAAHDTASQALTGFAAAGSTVTVYDGAAKLGVATANSSGQWSYTVGQLADGAHSLTATATDAAGNGSPTSGALQFTVNTQAPAPAPAPAIVAGVTISGARWADNLVGTAGNDTIGGGGGFGADTITGGAGDDVLTGGKGADRFVFGTGFGHDTITDFRHSQGDVLWFQGVGTPTYTDTSNGIVFSDSAGDTVLLQGVHTISSSDWVVI